MKLLFAGAQRHARLRHDPWLTEHATADPAGDDVSICHVRLCDLDDRCAERLLDRMRDVMVQTACPGEPPESTWAWTFWQDRRDAMRRGSSAYVYRSSTGAVVGFFVYRITRHRGRPCVHLESGYILEPYQSRGLALAGNVRAFLRALWRSPWRGVYIVGDVGSAIALWGWRKHVRSDRAFYPRLPGTGPPDPQLVAAAREYALERYAGAELEVATGRLKGRSIPRSGRFAECGQPDLDRWFEENMDPCAGDSVLMMIDGSPALVARHLVEVVMVLWRGLANRLARNRGGDR